MSEPVAKKSPLLIVVSGASGSGKTSICRRIADEFGLYYSISHTTRPQRDKEMNGRDYFFVSREEFENLLARGEFLEWATVYDNFYGTSRRILEDKLKQGKGVILDVDTQGADAIRQLFPDAVTIYLSTLTLDDLASRLRSRGRDSDNEILKRLTYAESENAKMHQYDHVVVNDDFDEALDRVRDIVTRQQNILQESS